MPLKKKGKKAQKKTAKGFDACEVRTHACLAQWVSNPSPSPLGQSAIIFSLKI
jgi:hypothetical protein